MPDNEHVPGHTVGIHAQRDNSALATCECGARVSSYRHGEDYDANLFDAKGWRDSHLANVRAEQVTTVTKDEQVAEFTGWWKDVAQKEIDAVVLKTLEYKGGDLDVIGFELARMAGREISREEAFELGVYFYLRGKVGRWFTAVENGQRVSDDTIFDIAVYTRMVQRIRVKGSWPGVEGL